MKKIIIRDLKPNEIDCRVQTVKPNGFSLLLYKDARVDMDILDETFGVFGWERIHSRDNANCTIRIYDESTGQWISKEDTGTESFTEKAKGLASDSFKRAGFNVGIGRELYTAPFIWISNTKYLKEYKGKQTVTERFHVAEIEIVDKKIESLIIADSRGNVVFDNKGYRPKQNKTKVSNEIKEKAFESVVMELINANNDDEFLEKQLSSLGVKALRELDKDGIKTVLLNLDLKYKVETKNLIAEKIKELIG